MAHRHLTFEQRLALAVDRALGPTGKTEQVEREMRLAVEGPVSPGIDRPVWLALRGAARAWLATGDNHPQRAALKAHLFNARQLTLKAEAPKTVRYTGGARPLFEKEA